MPNSAGPHVEVVESLLCPFRAALGDLQLPGSSSKQVGEERPVPREPAATFMAGALCLCPLPSIVSTKLGDLVCGDSWPGQAEKHLCVLFSSFSFNSVGWALSVSSLCE